jgi:hypothetical protein
LPEIAAGGRVAMDIDDPKIVALRAQVTAAQGEFDLAVAFHEVWKPTAYDNHLHARMGRSYASRAFLVVRASLRREMLLALARHWDTNKQAIRMSWIAETIRDKDVIETLATERVNRLGLPESIDQMRADLTRRAAEAVRPRPNSRVTSRQIDLQARNWPDSSPEPLEVTTCDPCVLDRMLRVSMPEVISDQPEVISDQPEVVTSVGEIKAA